jgi:hypothetical protein
MGRSQARAHPHHSHHHPEDYAARSHPEFVVLDIGSEVGALIIHTDPAMHGVEIEISREGQARDGSHKQVLERSAGGRAQYTAVFDGLPAGRYALWTGEHARAREVLVRGGGVTELELPVA